MTNFNRQYRLIAGVSGRKGFEIGSDNFPHKMPLHVSFDIEKSEEESPNTARVSVWNLSPQQLATLHLKDCIVEFRAGYGSNIGLIFIGNVTYVQTDTEGADAKTDIECVDGRVAIRDTHIELSYAGKINTKKIIADAAEKMGIPVTFSSGAKFTDLIKGFAFIGPAKTAIQKACASSKLVWSIQNGILHIRMPNEPISMRAFILNSDTGLIGIPKRIARASKDPDKGSQNSNPQKSQEGWEVRYFLNPAIGVDDYIKLESKVVTGNFRVSKVRLGGDNFDGEWICTATLLEV